MYQNPVLNAPLGPDGIPVQVEQDQVMEHYEVCGFMIVLS
jgi:splicing factor U2AF subunit